MDAFEQYIFDEITKQYAEEGLTEDDYEEIYERFCNIGDLYEVRPCLLTMRFFGWGTEQQGECVLDELRDLTQSGDPIFMGLYNDLLLISGNMDVEVKRKLNEAVASGYSEKYTKNKSHIKEAQKIIKNQEKLIPSIGKTEATNPNIKITGMSFYSKTYYGKYFSAGDIDYLYATVYIQPENRERKIRVVSQLFNENDTPYSEVFSNEYTLRPNASSFSTTGWGNKNGNSYSEGWYKWVITIDGTTIHYAEWFKIYSGFLHKEGIPIKDIKLFASGYSEITDADKENYAWAFDKDTLECVYFKVFVNPLEKNMLVQLFIKVIRLEDNTEFRNYYTLRKLDEQTIAFWEGVGFQQKGKWTPGLYKYVIRVGANMEEEGTFSVY